MTPPAKVIVGSWNRGQTRSLRYGTKAHGFEVIGTEIKNPGAYCVLLVEVVGEPRQRLMWSPHFKSSYQAHKWFLEQARALVS